MSTGKQKSGARKKLETGRKLELPPNLPGVPSMPAGLPKRAQEEWMRVIALLQKRGDLSELDQAAIADYCRCVAHLETVERDIAKRGVLVAGQRGKVKNPSLQIAREYRSALARWTDLLAMNPSSRNRMTFPDASDSSDDEILD
jgi:P27 family predicted phage terminase small subunit